MPPQHIHALRYVPLQLLALQLQMLLAGNAAGAISYGLSAPCSPGLALSQRRSAAPGDSAAITAQSPVVGRGLRAFSMHKKAPNVRDGPMHKKELNVRDGPMHKKALNVEDEPMHT
jgi:hypothetical protein